MAFPSTSTWTNWQTISITAGLNAGNNTIRATATGSSGANVDHLKVMSGTGGSLAAAARESTATGETITVSPVPAAGLLTIDSETDLHPSVRIADVKGIGFAPSTGSVLPAGSYSTWQGYNRAYTPLPFWRVTVR